MIWLYYSQYSPCFKSIVEVFERILTDSGIQCKITHELYDNDDTWIVWYPNLNKMPKNCVLYNMDPMTDTITSQMDKIIRDNPDTKFTFWDFCYSELTHQYYTSRKYKYKILLYGISRFQIYYPDINKGKQDIDILFYGGLNEKRIHILKDLENHCKEKNYKMVLRINDLYDEKEKAELIRRSKVVLSIPSEPAQYGKINDLARLSFIVANKGFIIGEKGGDYLLQSTSGIKYIELDKLKDTIDYYIKNDTERYENIKSVYNDFIDYFNLDKDLIELIN